MMIARVDTKGVEVALGSLKGQLPFAVSSALNETMLLAQATQRAHQRRSFKVRNARFLDQAVKIKPFASKSSLFTVIQVDPPGGQARASILTQHEYGGVKRPQGRSLFIPEPRGTTPAARLRSSTGGVKAGSGWRPRELGLKPHGKTGRVWKGEKRSFLIRTGDGEGIVLRRTGKGRARAVTVGTRRARWAGGRSRVSVLYILTPRGVLRPSLRFESNVLRVIERNWPHEILRATELALATARR